MKITVLDGYALNPGDLGWDSLSRLGEVEVFDRTESPEELFSRAAESDAVLINKIEIGKAELDRLPKLRYIGITATGYNNVDTAEARKHGVAVTNVPSYSTFSVAQHVFALLLEITDRTAMHSALVKDGGWHGSKDYCFYEGRLTELCGKTMGIVGMGNIGMRTAMIASALGMDVVYHSRSRKAAADELGFSFSTLDGLLEKSDVVSLHCPLSDDTRHMIDKRALTLMKRDAILINTARGALVDEDALFAALRDNRIRAAGLDVISEEPPRKDVPLFSLSNCIATPHTAWATFEARSRLMRTACSNLEAFLEGRTVNRVD